MITIYCFSGSGHSYAVSEVLSDMLECEITEIGSENVRSQKDEIAVIVFPVYCQNIAKPAKSFLKTLIAKHVVLIATYGKISYGNVLYEAQKLVGGQVIAGAYIPIGHTFLGGDYVFDEKFLLPIVERIKSPQKAHIPKTHKNFLANIFPDLRSQIGTRITKNNSCTNCGLCERLCPTGANKNGRINFKCMRCMKCVTNCPQKALQYKNSRILDKYLKSYYKDEYVLYL